MASLSEEDLSCPVCQEVYRDPVVLSCSHSFCRVCVESWWSDRETRDCPLCKKIQLKDPIVNRALRSVCEVFLERRESDCLCQLHQEKFKLFCAEHQKPLCLICAHSQLHSGHTLRPIEEAVPKLKKKLQKSLQSLKGKRQDFDRRKDQFSAAVSHIEAQARLTERQIQDQFKKLHGFLAEEEQRRITALRDEEEQKRKSLKQKMAAVSREIEALSETIRATEEQLGATHVSFTLHYKAVLERVQHRPLVEEPQLGPGALIDQAKHLGNLVFNIWNNMKDLVQFYPVVLDPNTAHPEQIISDSLVCVTYRKPRILPKNLERFEECPLVLGSEGFSSGSRCWEVEVIGDDPWSVGVVKESIHRKENVTTDVWSLDFTSKGFRAYFPTGKVKPLSVKRLQRVRVQLDFDTMTLSFFDADTNAHVHTFTHSFSETLYPLFQNYNSGPLKILPQNVDELTMNETTEDYLSGRFMIYTELSQLFCT